MSDERMYAIGDDPTRAECRRHRAEPVPLSSAAVAACPEWAGGMAWAVPVVEASQSIEH